MNFIADNSRANRHTADDRRSGFRRSFRWRRRAFTIRKFCLIALVWPLWVDGGNFGILTHEHVDGPFVVFTPGASSELALVLREDTASVNYTGTNVILVAKAESKLTLPEATPFGAGGAPFWILPQSQNPNLLYLGISAEGVPQGVFDGPLQLRLTRFEGPGYFMAWQATGPGQFNIRLDTRNGLDAADGFTPAAGAHEHYNWGFSTNGVYCVTFQVSGTNASMGKTVVSPEITVAFHVLPLPPPTSYPTWQKHFWPPGFVPSITATNGNEDGDAFSNLHEYAFGLSPTNSNALTNAPRFALIETNTQRFGALTFTRNSGARDLVLDGEVTSEVPASWTTVTNLHAQSTATNGVERVTVRDSVPATVAPTRFYQVQPRLLP